MIKILLLSLLVTVSCRGRKEFTRPGYIIGENDIERLNKIDFANIDIDSDVLEDAQRSSVLVVTRLEDGRAKHCSGSLIEAKEAGGLPRVVTNHHCFAKKLEDKNRSSEELIPEACNGTAVYFTTGIEDEDEETTEQTTGQKKTTKYREIPCQKGSLKTNYGADLAIFTIAEPLPDDYQPFKIWQGVIPANRPAFIIHHPSAEKTGDQQDKNSQEEIAGLTMPTKAITDKNCQVVGRFEPELWHQNPNLPFGLRHTCDLVNGSSGSGLIDAQTGQLLGVNWGGITFTIDDKERKDNVASSAEFLEQFVNEGDITTPTAPPKKSDSQWLCGVIAGHSPLTSTLLLVLPALIACLRRQGSSSSKTH